MATYIKLQFNDNVTINLSTSSFLYKNSLLLPLFIEEAPASLVQSFDINDDTTLRSGVSFADNIVPILCPSTYVTGKNGVFYFNNKLKLSFMFTFRTKSTKNMLHPSEVINICKFLDIICYENKDDKMSKLFINYVMKNSYMLKNINTIKYFMRPEINSIMNYINNVDIDIQIRVCTHTFYALYLKKYKEHVIKHNRQDIYNLSDDKKKYYKFICKYENKLTYMIKQTQEYNDYILDLSNQLIDECSDINNFSRVKYLVDNGADVNFQNNSGWTALQYAMYTRNNFDVIRYIIEHGVNPNIQNNNGYTALHIAASNQCLIEVIMCLISHGADVNIQNNNGNTALHIASSDINIIKCLINNGANINIQNNLGNTLLHSKCIYDTRYVYNTLDLIKYLIKHGADIKLQNNNGYTALDIALSCNDLDVVNYLRELN